MEGFAFIRGILDGRPELRVGDVAQQEAGADDSSKFAKGLTEAVLATAGSQSAKDRRGTDAASVDGENDTQHVGQMCLDQVPVDGMSDDAAGARPAERRNSRAAEISSANYKHEPRGVLLWKTARPTQLAFGRRIEIDRLLFITAANGGGELLAAIRRRKVEAILFWRLNRWSDRFPISSSL